MESDPRFDLELALSHWLRTCLEAGLEGEECEELEDHLRSTFAELVSSGMSPPDAFDRAQTALGNPNALSVELSSTRPIFRRLASAAMNLNPTSAILASTTVIVIAVLLASSHEPPYQMIANEGAVLRLDTRTGDVCAITIFAGSELTGDCKTSTGEPLSVNGLLEAYVLDFSGNLVRKPGSVTKASALEALEDALDDFYRVYDREDPRLLERARLSAREGHRQLEALIGRPVRDWSDRTAEDVETEGLELLAIHAHRFANEYADAFENRDAHPDRLADVKYNLAVLDQRVKYHRSRLDAVEPGP